PEAAFRSASTYLRRYDVTAPAQFRFRNAAQYGESFAHAPATGGIDGMHYAQVFGQQAVPGIAAWQYAQHFQDAGFPWWKFLESHRVTNDHNSKIGGIEIAVVSFQKDAADLLDHAIKIVDTAETPAFQKSAAELGRAHGLLLKFFPAAAMDEDAI